MASDPTQVYQQQVGFAPEIAPYAQRLLGAAEGSIFNYAPGTNQITGFKPYQVYGGERFAQFSPLQLQAMQAAEKAQVSPELGEAAGITRGIASLGKGYSYSPITGSFVDQGTAQSYMSPYMQNVVNMQSREAVRQADIARGGRGARYAQAGAFGGSRQAIENAEAERNLQQQLGDIQATGSQLAFQQAQQQFNTERQLGEQSRQFGAGIGLQGLQTGLNAAQQLGALGQSGFGQQQQIAGMQSQLGNLQQQQAQNILGAQYQDWLNAQNQPFRNLGFMSDVLRGAPLTQTGTAVYGQAPSTMSSLAGLGALGKGFGFFANGGAVESRPAGLNELALYNMGR